MDKSVVNKHYELISKAYPDIKATQLGMVCLMLGAIRASLGHESCIGTIEDYINPQELSPDVRKCLDFIERELLAIKRSKLDIDYYKQGHIGAYRRNGDFALNN